MIRVIVAGGRDFNDKYLMEDNLMEWILDIYLENHNKERVEIEFISGKARGADTLGEMFAKEHGYKVKEFPANWTAYGKSAGYIRNEQMAKYAVSDGNHGVLFAFWDGKSKGTKHMIDLAKKHGLEVNVVNY